jgi:hypothetical protein
MSKDELFQSGVKGMRWGIRKDKGKGGDSPKTKKVSVDIKQLSDSELKVIVERMNLEQRYSKMQADQKVATRGQKIAKFAGDIVVNSAKTAITTEVTRQFSSVLAKAIKP